MARFDVNISRYSILATFLCIGFLIMVAGSFKYITATDNTEKLTQSNAYYQEENSTPISTKTTKKDDEVSANDINEQTQTKNNDITATPKSDIPELEILTQDNTKVIEKSQYYEAEKLLKEEKYESAVYEYQKIAENSLQKNIQSNCYEQIALIYGKIKRYGTALTFAQKAFETESSISRELLLARLYYKTGNSEKANELISELLNRDFSAD